MFGAEELTGGRMTDSCPKANEKDVSSSVTIIRVFLKALFLPMVSKNISSGCNTSYLTKSSENTSPIAENPRRKPRRFFWLSCRRHLAAIKTSAIAFDFADVLFGGFAAMVAAVFVTACNVARADLMFTLLISHILGLRFPTSREQLR